MNTIAIAFLVLITVGCQPAHTDKPPEATPSIAHTITDTSHKMVVPSVQPAISNQYQCDWLDSCLFTLYPETWMDTVLAHPKASLALDDYCVLATIHSLEEGVRNNSCTRCMEVLNAIANVSDGYVGEALDEVAGRLYNDAFEPLIQFLADPRYDSERLLDNLVYSFYYEIISDRELVEQRRTESIVNIQQKMRNKELTEAQIRVLSKLEKKVRELKTDE